MKCDVNVNGEGVTSIAAVTLLLHSPRPQDEKGGCSDRSLLVWAESVSSSHGSNPAIWRAVPLSVATGSSTGSSKNLIRPARASSSCCCGALQPQQATSHYQTASDARSNY